MHKSLRRLIRIFSVLFSKTLMTLSSQTEGIGNNFLYAKKKLFSTLIVINYGFGILLAKNALISGIPFWILRDQTEPEWNSNLNGIATNQIAIAKDWQNWRRLDRPYIQQTKCKESCMMVIIIITFSNHFFDTIASSVQYKNKFISRYWFSFCEFTGRLPYIWVVSYFQIPKF